MLEAVVTYEAYEEAHVLTLSLAKEAGRTVAWTIAEEGLFGRYPARVWVRDLNPAAYANGEMVQLCSVR